MHFHADISRNEHLARNLDDAAGWLGTADTALTSAVQQLQRVSSLVVQARNASTDANGRETIASEIEAIRGTLISLANSQYAGRAVFAGTSSGTVAYDADGAYVGFSAPVERTIAPGQRVQVNVSADDAFGRAGNDVFTTLARLANAVRNDPATLDSLSATLDQKTLQVQSQLGEVGARFQRVEAMQGQNQQDAVTMKKNLSNLEDADIAQVMMQLQTQQVAYQAALQATARAIQPSLADFLR
jgi:flagellar hook-associated protein 3 FlgL